MAAQWSATLRLLYDLRIAADGTPVTTDAQAATAKAIRLAQQAMQLIADLLGKCKS